MATGLAVLVLPACGHTRKSLVFDKTLDLPDGRFVGPVVIEVPRRPDDSLRDYEVRAELVASCGPLLRLSFPDGEASSVGDASSRWQTLLSLRASHPDANAPTTDAPANDTPTTDLPAAATNPDATTASPAADATSDPYGNPTGAVPTSSAAPATTNDQTMTASADATPTPSAAPGAQPITTAPAPGHWQQVTSESWQGQLEFLKLRDRRCAATKHYTRVYRSAYDESGKVTVWADVPQELASAQLRVRVYEIIDDRRERRAAARAQQQERARERDAQRAAEARANASAELTVRVSTPRPPMPPPKKESPKAAIDAGATWTAGHWAWSSNGKWVWIDGSWAAPARVPGLRTESPGAPPVAGCGWQRGHWEWVAGPGRWDWIPGYWTAPPPKVETPGTPPVPESPWVDGRWIKVGASFEWVAGYWGTPKPRKESIPPPPSKDARWHAGMWIQIRGKWIWSAGYYEQSHKAPPPRKNERPGPSPRADAVWLAGFWRWDVSRNDYQWVDGHWELPPGEGYVWVNDPIDPQLGYATSGQWKLRIDIDVNVPVKVRVKP